jgi:deoxyribodipyrimidine photo-lyase
MATYQRSLHIFRRDLRTADNTALNAALTSSREVVACFIFNDAQVREHRYRSVNGLAFMIESLEELEKDISSKGGKLLFLHGDSKTIVSDLITKLGIQAVFVNKDYTPFSQTRDKALADLCASKSVAFHAQTDLVLVDPENFGKDDGKPYTVFTPFFKKASRLDVPKPHSSQGTFASLSYDTTVSPRDFRPSVSAPQRLSLGGRTHGLAILESIGSFKKYEEERNIPALRGTTILAPHNKFGTVSVREVYHAIAASLGLAHSLIREIYWRDFFTHIARHFPHVFGHAFHRVYDKIRWNKSEEDYDRWCSGRTGFPIVDAGMRELVTTGFMHNRVRMIVASFLVKDLHINWQRGEEFFARHLTDYDPCVNNGSWQWAASTGCDAQPYFRIFNPWLQQKRFDPDCDYIKKWVPELASVAKKTLHTLFEEDLFRPSNYPAPMVEHSRQKILAEEMFRNCLGRS